MYLPCICMEWSFYVTVLKMCCYCFSCNIILLITIFKLCIFSWLVPGCWVFQSGFFASTKSQCSWLRAPQLITLASTSSLPLELSWSLLESLDPMELIVKASAFLEWYLFLNWTNLSKPFNYILNFLTGLSLLHHHSWSWNRWRSLGTQQQQSSWNERADPEKGSRHRLSGLWSRWGDDKNLGHHSAVDPWIWQHWRSLVYKESNRKLYTAPGTSSRCLPSWLRQKCGASSTLWWNPTVAQVLRLWFILKLGFLLLQPRQWQWDGYRLQGPIILLRQSVFFSLPNGPQDGSPQVQLFHIRHRHLYWRN